MTDVDDLVQRAQANDKMAFGELYELFAPKISTAETALEWVLAVVAVAGVSGDAFPGDSGIGGGGGANLVPAVNGVAGRIAEIPTAAGGRRGNALPALRQGSAPWCGDCCAGGLEGATQPAG